MSTRQTKYVIECRNREGALDFTGAQPEKIFGIEAITGISENRMTKTILARVPGATLRGDNIPFWPALIDARFVARVKTW